MPIDEKIKRLWEKIDSHEVIEVAQKYFFPLSQKDIGYGMKICGPLGLDYKNCIN